MKVKANWSLYRWASISSHTEVKPMYSLEDQGFLLRKYPTKTKPGTFSKPKRKPKK